MSIHIIQNHFQKVDPILWTVMSTMEVSLLQPNKNAETYFAKLCREIIGQQLSGKVVDVIFGRFQNLFSDQEITVKVLLSLSDQQLRDIGMSWAKVKYVKDLALKTKNQEIHFSHLPAMADEEVITELTKIKGIGRWTAEMFLMFTLGREDVFSFGDLGLRRGLEKIYGLDKKDSVQKKKKILKITEQWKPYRSYGSLALWHSLNNR